MEKLIAARTLIGRLSLIALILSFAGVCDGLLSSFLTPENQFDMIMGRSSEIIGKFYGNSRNVSELGYVSDSKDVSVHFNQDAFKGFWLGEDMWRGNVTVNPGMKEGTYTLRITFKDLSVIKPKDRPKLDKLLTYSVRVFKDAESMRKKDRSASIRYLGVSPWIVSASGLPIILVTGFIVFILSLKIDKGMAENGKAEIYRVSKKDDGIEIHFGLGKNHGLSLGERLMLFNKSGLLITELFVDTLDVESATALLDGSHRITPGFLVSRI